jgi:putative acyl-CoA dehydrogenase
VQSTHKVFNQPLPLVDYNLFTSDRALAEHLARYPVQWATETFARFGARIGSAEVTEWGFQANRSDPVLHTHDPTGHRIDEITFHPAYHSLMALSMEYGLHSLPWEGEPGAYVTRATLFSLMAQIEAGHGCPISMTTSVVPSLRKQPDLAARWEKRLTRTYDPSAQPADRKTGVTFGMALTEKQGGSDVRSNASTATPIDGGYSITGHKWFCSAPMSDAFLVLAVAPEGLTCFLLPRWTPDGVRNGFTIQRLKDKLGNRSNASSEVEFRGSWAERVGDEGDGVRVIVEMINHTRLDCVLGSAGLMRQAVAQATHHASQRTAFGRVLADQPAMVNVLADLALESEAATAVMLRVASAFDNKDDEQQELFRRIATPVTKYWVTKRTPGLAYEALECLGGNGYVEESIMPRLFRESPVNAVWEGSGNVIALDVLRALRKSPNVAEAFLAELRLAQGSDSRFDAALDQLSESIHGLVSESEARRAVESMALLLQASLLIRSAPTAVGEAFLSSRLTNDRGGLYGTLPGGVDQRSILERAMPAV